MRHELKTWPEPFAAMWDGRKLFEIRKNDRGFKEGDLLLLREWEPVPHTIVGTGHYTGRWLTGCVTYIVSGGEWGLPAGLCVFGVAFQSRGTTGMGDAL